MASVARMMEVRDLGAVRRLIGGDFPPNFLSVVYERDGAILGWICCQVKDNLPVAQAATARGFSGFAARRMVEVFERFLHKLGLYFYVFGVHVKRKKWFTALERLGVYEKYATESMHHWYRRRIR